MGYQVYSVLRQAVYFSSTLIIVLTNIVNAQTWNPQPGWKDSYAVAGKCYCDSNGYDHNLDSKFANTPIGSQNVVDICNAIESVLGKGPVNGRIPYNDIQCGNGPANDAADEAGCPGRVDIGPAGCNQIGPKWDLQTVYVNNPNIGNSLDRNNWVLSANHNNGNVGLMIDGLASTRWSTGTPQSAGQYITVDLNETLSFNRIVLDSSSSNDDYPRSYSVFVSSNGINWGTPLKSGISDRSITNIEFPNQIARHIKITQTGNNQNFWWSIHELNIFNDQNSSTPPPSTPRPPKRKPPTSAKYISPVISLLLGGDSNSNVDEQTGIVTYTYSKHDGPSKNPLKGWNSGWWNQNEDATIGFQYLPWKEFEPTNGSFNFDNVEEIIARPGSKDLHFILRLYCDWHGTNQESRGCPDWIYNEVGVQRLQGENGRYITDYNNPQYINEAKQAIKALGERYDDDPRVHSFQIGVLGYWGEWHTFGSQFSGQSYEISEENQREILETYIGVAGSAFEKAKIIGRYPYNTTLNNAGNIGFHNDYFRPDNGHSAEFSDFVSDNQKWLDGPIGGEMPPEAVGPDLFKLYLTQEGMEMIETGHYSNMQPTEINNEHRAQYLKMHKRMGYNYQIEQAMFAQQLSSSATLNVELNLTNIGVAPFYYDWVVQFALLDQNSQPLSIVEAQNYDLTQYMPNQPFNLNAAIPLNQAANGQYNVGIRIIQRDANQSKPEQWKLYARNTYIEFANNIPVIIGTWDSNNSLVGGWSIYALSLLQKRKSQHKTYGAVTETIGTRPN